MFLAGAVKFHFTICLSGHLSLFTSSFTCLSLLVCIPFQCSFKIKIFFPSCFQLCANWCLLCLICCRRCFFVSSVILPLCSVLQSALHSLIFIFLSWLSVLFLFLLLFVLLLLVLVLFFIVSIIIVVVGGLSIIILLVIISFTID